MYYNSDMLSFYNIYVANAFSFVAAAFLGYSTFAKNKSKMISMQFVTSSVNTFSCLFSGSYAGMTTNAVGAIRNLALVKTDYSKHKYIAVFFTILCGILGFLFNTKGIIGILPVIASMEFTLCTGFTKNTQVLRFALLVNLLMWLAHDIYMILIPSTIMDIVISCTCIYNLIKLRKNDEGSDKKQ